MFHKNYSKFLDYKTPIFCLLILFLWTEFALAQQLPLTDYFHKGMFCEDRALCYKRLAELETKEQLTVEEKVEQCLALYYLDDWYFIKLSLMYFDLETTQTADAYCILGVVYMSLADEYIDTAQYYMERCEKSFKKALKVHPFYPIALTGLGSRYYYLSKDFNNAIPYYQKALEKDDKLVQANVSLAMCYRKKGQYEKSKEHLKKALKIQPDNHKALIGMAILFRDLGDKERTTSYTLQAAEHIKLDYSFNDSLYNTLYRIGNYSAAIEFIKARRYNYTDDAFFFRLGSCYYSLGNYEKALRYTLKCFEINPKYSDVSCWVGYCHKILGETENAIQYLEKCLELNPNHSDVRHYLADFYHEIGETEKAKQLLKEQLKLHPDDNKSKELLDKIKSEELPE